MGNRLKLERAICLEKRNSIGAKSENLVEPHFQLIKLYCRLIDPDRPIRRNLHGDRFGSILGDSRP